MDILTVFSTKPTRQNSYFKLPTRDLSTFKGIIKGMICHAFLNDTYLGRRKFVR